MYELFTDRARKVMQLANQEAQRFNHEYIGTEHVLLGLIAEGSGVAANVLKNLDVDLRKIRLEVEKMVQSGPDIVTIGKLPQTPRAKKVIEYSMEEARNLGHNYVGTEHILLGLLREQEGVAAQALMNLGLRLQEVRDELALLLGSGIRSTPRPSLLLPLSVDTLVEDLPEELETAVDELDTEIGRITLRKEEAVAAQDFQQAAAWRDEAERLKRARRTMLREWIVNRPIDRSWLSANAGAVVKLARSIGEERSWSLLPALADALEAAGCCDMAILGHCRQAGKHSDRCWVVDLLLANASV